MSINSILHLRINIKTPLISLFGLLFCFAGYDYIASIIFIHKFQAHHLSKTSMWSSNNNVFTLMLFLSKYCGFWHRLWLHLFLFRSTMRSGLYFSSEFSYNFIVCIFYGILKHIPRYTSFFSFRFNLFHFFHSHEEI